MQLTGRKRTAKTYYRHTGYPGGIRSTTADKVLEGKHPERVVLKAVQRMLPGNRLSRKTHGRNLRVYAGPDHPHEAQKPEAVNVAAMNSKKTLGDTGHEREN